MTRRRHPRRSRFRGSRRAFEAARRFEPPFCPYSPCRAHRQDARSRGWKPQRRGGRPVPSRRTVVWRFTCPWCRRSFSSSVFGPDYRCRIAGLAVALFDPLCEGQAERQAARSLGVSPGGVRRRRIYLAGQCLLILKEFVDRLPWDRAGRFELDGLRSFAGSQYEPVEISTPIWPGAEAVVEEGVAPLRRSGPARSRGCRLTNAVDNDAAPLRRPGRMSTGQRRIRAERVPRWGGGTSGRVGSR
ncbi:MAG: hypothetical protein D6718_10255 [Acidobacteria bacterium]|nr:MAG: hypothetical protein D6718_10255 [Acidobacteriota bacterium]